MYDIKWIRDHRKEFDRGLFRRGLTPFPQYVENLDSSIPLGAEALLTIDKLRREGTTKPQGGEARRDGMFKKKREGEKKKKEPLAKQRKGEGSKLKDVIATYE